MRLDFPAGCQLVRLPIVFLLLLSPLSPALAHALVVTSLPAASGTVVGPQFELRVQFSDRIDKKRSKLSLADASGRSYPIEPIEVESPDTLAGRVAGLAAGRYRLLWQVLAVDGHITRGEIPFTVTAP